MTGRVLVAATGKGGAGKSTVIACLAMHWTKRGRAVALVDADPNRTLSRWHSKGGALAGLTLRAETDEHAIIPLIGDLSESHDLVLVDCAGFGNQAMVFAIGAADLVLIPVMTDEANVFEAVRTRKLVESAGRLTRRTIASRTLMTRVKRATVSTHTWEQLVALQAEPLASRMIDRAIYQEASYHGSSPIDLDPTSAAAEDIASLAGELEGLEWWPWKAPAAEAWEPEEAPAEAAPSDDDFLIEGTPANAPRLNVDVADLSRSDMPRTDGARPEELRVEAQRPEEHRA